MFQSWSWFECEKTLIFFFKLELWLFENANKLLKFFTTFRYSNWKITKSLISCPPSSSQSWSTNFFRIIRFENVRFKHLFNFYDSPNFPKLLVISFNPNILCIFLSPTPFSKFVPMNHERKPLHLRRGIPQKACCFYPCLDFHRVSGFHKVLFLLSQFEIETILLHS